MYQVGDHVSSYNSGLVYIIKEVIALDIVGTRGYRVRRLRGGKEYGPHRVFGETSIGRLETKDAEPFVYDEGKMFPFATSRHTMTD